jgi:hypothetical protein
MLSVICSLLLLDHRETMTTRDSRMARYYPVKNHQLIVKYFEDGARSLIWFLSWHLRGLTEHNSNHRVSQDSPSPFQNTNQGPSECESGVATTR